MLESPLYLFINLKGWVILCFGFCLVDFSCAGQKISENDILRQYEKTIVIFDTNRVGVKITFNNKSLKAIETYRDGKLNGYSYHFERGGEFYVNYLINGVVGVDPHPSFDVINSDTFFIFPKLGFIDNVDSSYYCFVNHYSGNDLTIWFGSEYLNETNILLISDNRIAEQVLIHEYLFLKDMRITMFSKKRNKHFRTRY